MNRKVFLKQRLQLLLAAALMAGAYTATADNSFDLEKIAQCVACHGADGIGKAIQYPNLQNKPIDYIVTQLKLFKSGDRKSSTMNTIAKTLSDEDIRMLAMFFNHVR
ncbi:MAG: c-type cytochrome [Candidatus Thiodiazotropha sp. (ex. Lucinoma kazani)]